MKSSIIKIVATALILKRTRLERKGRDSLLFTCKGHPYLVAICVSHLTVPPGGRHHLTRGTPTHVRQGSVFFGCMHARPLVTLHPA